MEDYVSVNVVPAELGEKTARIGKLIALGFPSLPSHTELHTGIGWFGVYDGHGGESVSRLCQQNLFNLFMKE